MIGFVSVIQSISGKESISLPVSAQNWIIPWHSEYQQPWHKHWHHSKKLRCDYPSQWLHNPQTTRATGNWNRREKDGLVQTGLWNTHLQEPSELIYYHLFDITPCYCNVLKIFFRSHKLIWPKIFGLHLKRIIVQKLFISNVEYTQY